MNQDDKALGQQLLRVILGNPQLQTAIGLSLSLFLFGRTTIQLKQYVRKQSLLSCRMNSSRAGAFSRLLGHLIKTRYEINISTHEMS